MESFERHDVLAKLVGGFAHDFNNMLTVILGITDDLRASGFGTPQQRDDLALLQQAGESATALTRQLLILSRRRATQPATFVLDAAIGSLTGLLTRLLGERFVLETDLQAQDGYVYIDPSALDEVLMALVELAQGSLPSGSRIVLATSRVTDAEWESALRISVSSATVTRAGHERITALLQPPDSGDAAEASGLGRLRRLLVAAGGRIATGPDASLAAVYLPEQTVTQNPAGVVEQDLPSGPRVVLVVEDDPHLRSLTTSALRGSGCVVITAATVDEAQRLAIDLERLDVLFADLVLPDRDGTALPSALRDRFPQMQVVYTSGYAHLPPLIDPDSLATSRFLRKPYTASQLREMVGR